MVKLIAIILGLLSYQPLLAQNPSAGSGLASADGEGLQNPPRTKVNQGGRDRPVLPNEKEAQDLKPANAPKVRRFHEVLNELLTEFSHDVKLGQINGLKNISIRKVTVSNTLPRSYRQYMEMLVSEAMREHAKVRIINCIPCKTKTSRMVDGKLIITSPTTNMQEMRRSAMQLGVDYFMDVVLVYHSTHMVLAFEIFNTQTSEMAWSRTYNSETIRSRFQKLAIDFSQIERSDQTDEYVPSFRTMLGLGGVSVPNVGGTTKDSSFVALVFRATEKFNNRSTEFGLHASFAQSTSAILKDYPAEEATNEDTSTSNDEVVLVSAEPKPFTSAVLLYAIYSHNLVGNLESYDNIRYGFNIGLGSIIASGYLAGSFRAGLDTFFGKRFTLSLGGIFINGSTVVVGDETITTKGGGGGELSVSYNF